MSNKMITSTAIFTFHEDGIVEMRSNPDNDWSKPHTVEDAEENVKALKDRDLDYQLAYVVEFPDSYLNAEVRDVYLSYENLLCAAIVVDSFAKAVIASTMVKKKKDVPLKVFSKFDKALSWARNQLTIHKKK